MKLTESELNQIIQEEIHLAIEEGLWDQFRARQKSMGSRAAAWGSEKVGKGFGKIGAKGTAASFAGGAEELRGIARGKEGLHLLSAHTKKIQKKIKDMLADAAKLGLTNEPTIKAALQSMIQASQGLTQAIIDNNKTASATLAAAQGRPGEEPQPTGWPSLGAEEE